MIAQLRVRGWLVGLALVAAVAGLWLWPTSTAVLRLGTVLATVASFAWVALHRPRRRAALGMGAIGLAVVCAALVLALRAPSSLHQAYRAELLALEGTRYHWGGENGLGIDCSGLARIALVRAQLGAGLRGLRPGTLARAAELWWHDRSARALGDGYRGDTRLVTSAASIAALDHAGIAVGDLAVTADGVHVLIYVGDEMWIQADPHVGRVRRVHRADRDEPWLRVPVQIMRWRELDRPAVRPPAVRNQGASSRRGSSSLRWRWPARAAQMADSSPNQAHPG